MTALLAHLNLSVNALFESLTALLEYLDFCSFISSSVSSFTEAAASVASMVATPLTSMNNAPSPPLCKDDQYSTTPTYRTGS